MDFNKLTIKSQEAIAAAQEDARHRGNPEMLALRLLEGEFSEGDTVRVDVKDGGLVFENAKAAEPAAA